MAAQEYQAKVQAYQEAIANLYAQSVKDLAERGGGDITAAPDLEDRADVVINRSQELGQALVLGQASADPEQRELAQLQLLAAAALDLHIASDLVRRAEEGVPEEVVERDAALPSAVVKLQDILNAEPEKGMAGLLKDQLERTKGPSHPQEAKQELRDAVEGALIDIRDDTVKVGQAAFTNLMQLPAPAVKEAANVVLAELMTKVGEGIAKLVNKAVSLIIQAIEKIWQALGKDVQDKARKQAAEWIEDLQKGTLFGTLLDKLYETERILKHTDEQLAKAPRSLEAARYNKASQQVADLATRFRKQTQTITWLLHGLSWARPWIMAVEPVGPLALTAGYVITIGYIVYLGGDYVDWFRTERLNVVPGVRSVVRQELRAA